MSDVMEIDAAIELMMKVKDGHEPASSLCKLKKNRFFCGETLLQFIVIENMVEYCVMLIANNFSVNVANKFGETPLQESCALGYARMTEILLKSGALPNHQDECGNTALHRICRSNIKLAKKNRSKIVGLLLEYGANRKIKNSFGESPKIQSTGHAGAK